MDIIMSNYGGCHAFAGHPGLPQTFTALPKVMPVSKGILKPRCHAGTGSAPLVMKVPESVQRWAEMCGAHFHAPLEPGSPPYDPDLDPVLQVRPHSHCVHDS